MTSNKPDLRIRTQQYLHLSGALLKTAERQAQNDPNSGIIKMRQISEMMARCVLENMGLDVETQSSQIQILEELEKTKNLPPHILNAFHSIRKAGNKAAHQPDFGTTEHLKALIRDSRDIMKWVQEQYLPLEKESAGDGSTTNSRTEKKSRQNAKNRQPENTDNIPADWPSDSANLLKLIRECINDAENVNKPTQSLKSAEQLLCDQTDAALAPFCLGIVGEFRSGKSTLINALMGVELALTDIVETTAVISSYGFGPQRQARWKYTDGSEEITSPEEANARLSKRRTDSDWLKSIVEVNFTDPSVQTRNWLLWDGPGLGGNDFNETMANRFITKVSAAVWVFDTSALGNATVVGPLNALRASGKPLLACLNRIDFIDADQIPEAIEFLKDTYDVPFTEVLPICASEAMHLIRNGDPAPMLESLRNGIQATLVNTSRDTLERRLAAARFRSAESTINAIQSLRKPIREKMDLIQHVQLGHEKSIRSIVADLPERIETAAASIWSDAERAALDKILRYTSRGSFLKANDAIEKIEDILRVADAESPMDSGWEILCHRIMNHAAADWAEKTAEEVELVRSSVPSSVFLDTNTLSESHFDDPVADPEKDGLVAGGLSAAALGVLAAASVAITWPIILAAVPIGIGVSHFSKRSHEESKQMMRIRCIDSAEQRLQDLFAHKRRKLAEIVRSDFVPRLEAQLLEHSESRLQEMKRHLFSTTTYEDMEKWQQTSNFQLDALSSICQRDAEHEKDRARYLLPVSPSDAVSPERIIRSEPDKVDLLLSDRTLLIPEWFGWLRPEVVVRVLFCVDRHAEDEIRSELMTLFRTWTGELTIQNIRRSSGEAIRLPSILITSTDAWNLHETDNGLHLMPFKGGRLVAERKFATYWLGRIPAVSTAVIQLR